ncbi:MAG: hypothetical protein ABIS48_01865 [Candidatus Saccharimonadales bacterium]
MAFINSIGLQKIYLIDKTYQTTYQVGAAYNPTNKFMYYDTTFGDSTYSRAELIHHEFFHYVDSVRFGDIANTSDVNWTSLNPSGFTYTSTGQSCYQAACPTGEHPLAGFATGYATTLEPEDRAETAAYLMETDNYTKLTGWQATDAVLASKVTYIKNIYKAFDVTMNDAYFTAIHAYAQANYNLQFYSQITADNHITTDQLGGNYIVNSQATLTVDAKINRATVLSGGILKGSGTVTSGINVDPGGIIAPGHSPGCITTTDLVVGGTYQAELGGATACNGYDQIKATSSVTLFSDGGIGGNIDGILQLVLYGGFVPNVGDKFTIIDNQSSAAVSGNFKGLDESAQFTQDGVTYSVTYKGGDGNDVVLTVMSVNAAALPKAPNTGFELLTANPLASLLVTVLAGSSLLFMSRRIAVANN